MGLARPGLLRDSLASLAVVGVVAAVAFGLPFLDRRVPDTRPVAAGVPYPVGGGVSVAPPPGARIDVTRTRPGPDRGTALFIVRGVRAVVVVTPYRGDLQSASDRLRHKIVRVADAQLSGADGPIRTGSNVVGRHGHYRGQGRAGTYAVFVANGRSAEVTVSGSEGDLAQLGEEFHAIVSSLTFGGGR
jgi:hypothetical protein